MATPLDTSNKTSRGRRTCTVPVIASLTTGLVILLLVLRSQPQLLNSFPQSAGRPIVTVGSEPSSHERAEAPPTRPSKTPASPTPTASPTSSPSLTASPSASLTPSASPSLSASRAVPVLAPGSTAAQVADVYVPVCPTTRSWTVLGVTPWFNGDHPWAQGMITCPNGCRISYTHNMGTLVHADLLLYHARDADHGHMAMPRSSMPRQRRALMASETMNLAAYDSEWYKRFNSEVSFRPASFVRDTYVYWLFGMGVPHTIGGSYTGKFSTARCFNDIWQPPLPTAQRNTDVVGTWASGHCSSKSGREAYIRQLMTYTPLRIVGDNCLSNRSDPFNAMDRDAQFKEFRKFKFHLAFENHRCEGYVTEKFYQSLWLGQVPIVLGAPNIVDHAPPRSFIDASRYTPEELGRYLNHLNDNDTAYDEYHAWRHLGFETYGVHMRREFLSVLRLADDPSVGTRDHMWQNCIFCNALECDAASATSSESPPLVDGIKPMSESCLQAWPQDARNADADAVHAG